MHEIAQIEAKYSLGPGTNLIHTMSEPFELIYPASGLHIWIVPTIAKSDGLDEVAQATTAPSRMKFVRGNLISVNEALPNDRATQDQFRL